MIRGGTKPGEAGGVVMSEQRLLGVVLQDKQDDSLANLTEHLT